MPGAPNKLYSLRDHEEFCSLIFRGATMEEAAEKIGFHPTTVYRHMADDPDLRAPYDRAREVAREYRADRVRDKLGQRALNDEDPKSADLLKYAASIWLSEARQGLSHKLEVSGGLEIAPKVVSATEILKYADEHGLAADLGLDRPQRALPTAGEVRSAQPEPPASGLPPN